MNGEKRFIKDVFPKPKTLSTSHVYTTAGGQQLKWKSGGKLHCVDSATGLNIATYYRNRFYLFNNKKSTLDIAPAAIPLLRFQKRFSA
ncbi:hypothetical protein RhiLY_04738 [Ceratobasidium sp. AG-Ba]|nr:hypothetical protein RhiLY_04738 [Ceratobasidium sp. AG-Ba]